jgi:hypothetical protein
VVYGGGRPATLRPFTFDRARFEAWLAGIQARAANAGLTVASERRTEAGVTGETVRRVVVTLCRVCGSEFEAARRSGVYCSDACRMRAYRRRKKTVSA